MTRALASVLVLLAASSGLVAQTDARENCDLLVRIRTSDERSIEAPLQVELFSARGLLATVHVTAEEPAQFRVANGKTYRVKVSGVGIETVTTPYFEVNPLEPSHEETVRVKLENQKQPGESTPASPTISVSEMKVPKKASAEMNKALEAYSKGDMDKAAARLEKAIAEYPRYARAYDMLGVVAIKGDNRVKARELFSKSIQMDVTFLPAYVDLARLDLQDQNYAETESLLSKVIAVNPSMVDAVALLATSEFANKEYDKALADVQRTHALPNHQQFAEVHIMAGKALRMQNHLEAAVEQFQLFLIEKPDSPQCQSVRDVIASLTARQTP